MGLALPPNKNLQDMRKLYTLLAAVIVALTSFGQTNPTPQGLPYTFASLTGSALPQGMAAHRFSSIPTTRITTPGTTDITYPGSNTSGGWRDEGVNGISLLASGSQQAGAIVVAINTTGLSNIQVAWTGRTILQQTSRDNSIALQYRIGTTGNFIDVGTTSTYTSQGKTVGDAASFSETLPTAAENQPEVQVRWIYWESNGTSGSRDRIAVDDVTISGTGSGGDTNPPLVSSLSPSDDATNVAINTTATITFNETVQKGTGNIYVRRVSDNVAIQTLDVTTASVNVGGTQASLALTLANSTAYYIEVDAGAFKDIANNNFAGISGNSTWNFTTVAPPADGIIGNTYTFNNCGNYFNEGFETYSVTGAQVWSCTKFGRTFTTDPSLDSAIEMNGFASGNQNNEDWLISPKFDLTGTNVPLLNFYTKNAFPGPSLSLRVSTNYSGSGDPALATWTTINGEFPAANSNVWSLSDSVNLSAFKSSNVHIAWVYNSTTMAAARWTLDDITIYNSAVAPMPSLTVYGNLLDFYQVSAGTSSAGKTFGFFANDFTTDLTITAPAGFEVSKDNTTWSSSLTYTPLETNVTLKTVYVRFSPTAGSTIYSGQLQFSRQGINTNAVFVKGNSHLSSTTLNIVNWNIENFGSTAPPVDDDLAQANAKKVMDALDADVYALAEIVNVTRFNNLVSSLAGTYAYVIAEHCSGGTTAGACATAQKLAFVYKTSVLSNVTARPLMINSPDAIANFANGRVPFLVTADVNKNGQTTQINFVVIHAKANTGNTQEQIDAYLERKNGNRELKDTLDTYFPTANIVLLGDFNDDLDRTIAPTTGNDTVSSYQNFVADSTDGNSYRSLTLPLSLFKLSSTTGFPDVIDHVIISNEMASRYLGFSASIYNDIEVVAGITDFDGTTSDHYPVMTRFLFGGTLPVRLVSFTASKENNAAKLNWTTSQEINSKEFVVERSTDGVRFENMTIVNARGASTTATSYQAIDTRPVPGNNYYRLKSVDLDGKFELSKVIKINFSKTFTVSLTPNPASSFITINLTNNREPLAMQLMDMHGRVVKTAILSNQANPVSLTGLSKGLYLIKLKGASETYTEKFVIE